MFLNRSAILLIINYLSYYDWDYECYLIVINYLNFICNLIVINTLLFIIIIIIKMQFDN